MLSDRTIFVKTVLQILVGRFHKHSLVCWIFYFPSLLFFLLGDAYGEYTSRVYQKVLINHVHSRPLASCGQR